MASAKGQAPRRKPATQGEAEGPAQAAPRAFQAEVAKLLHLMVHSVYSEREVFLRELVSNAADALDKLRYAALHEPALTADGAELRIVITPDTEARTLTVADTGIGMDGEEMAAVLGTIARSGTQAFMDEAREADGMRLIGQFGVGFYAAFMVAGRVEVISRKAGAAQAHMWASDGEGTFTVEPYQGADAPSRGTLIRLHLRDDAGEFAEDWRLEQIVRTYSDHVAHPILLGERQINSASALWTRPRAEITPEQHREFFGHVCGIHSDPALTLHYRAEGRNEYTVLLYVPGERPFDLYDPERRGRQRLYVRRVFITAEADLLPAYLRFVRGVIDSEDMPLNISREMLQDNATVQAIRKAVTNRVLGELRKCADTDGETFARIWAAFGAVLKEGLYEDLERRDQLYGIARFRTTASDAETVSLADYVERLRPEQTAIYYLTAEDPAKAAASPQLEGYRARGVEVLLLTDPVDPFWVRTAAGYGGKLFRSITQGAAELDRIPLVEPGAAPEETAAGSALAVLAARLKEVLGERVSEVRSSARLTTSPVCLVAGEAGLDRTLEKILARQKTTGVTASAPVLEINPAHPLIAALAAGGRCAGAAFEDAARLLLDQAQVLDGEPPADPAAFAARLSRLMQQVYG